MAHVRRRHALTIASVALFLYLLSYISGGFVLLANWLDVGMESVPLLVLLLRAVIVALAALVTVPVYIDMLRESGSWAGVWAVVVAAMLVMHILSLASSTMALLDFIIFVLPVFTALWSELSRPMRLIPALLLASFVALGLLSAYSPVAASGHVAVLYARAPVDVNGFKRFVPLMTAYTYASDRVQSPVHRIYPGDSYVYYNGSHSIYNWIIEPEGLWNELTRRPLGVVFVYGDEYPPRVRFVEHRLAWGLHNKRFLVLLIDELKRHIMTSCGLQYKPLLEDNIEILYHGRVYILVPLETWRRGLLYSLPVLAGYAVVGENGDITCIPADRLRESPLMKGLPLLPEKIARDWVETYRYSVGFIAFYFYHNTYVIRDVGTNPQPYLEQGSDGRQYWVFVAEPAGKTYSAKYIIYIDSGYTGEPRILVYRLPRPVIGVSKVASYVKQAHPTFDWSQLSIQEPMPAIINGTLYWKVTVTTRDYRGLVSVDTVNAYTGQVYSMKPSGNVTWESLLVMLRGAPAHPGRHGQGSTPAEKVAELEKRIDQLMRQLQEMKKELEELRKQLANETGGR